MHVTAGAVATDCYCVKRGHAARALLARALVDNNKESRLPLRRERCAARFQSRVGDTHSCGLGCCMQDTRRRAIIGATRRTLRGRAAKTARSCCMLAIVADPVSISRARLGRECADRRCLRAGVLRGCAIRSELSRASSGQMLPSHAHASDRVKVGCTTVARGHE